MFSYARAVNTEITGFSNVEVRDNREFYVSETFIFPQVGEAAFVKLDSGALLDWMGHCKKIGRPQLPGTCRLWWHSHVKMNCFRSGTDNDTVERLLTSMPFVISCVVNQNYQYELSLHLKDPYRITFNNMNPYTDRIDDGKLDRDCDREARQMVKEPPKPKYDLNMWDKYKTQPVEAGSHVERAVLREARDANSFEPFTYDSDKKKRENNDYERWGYTKEEWDDLVERFPALYGEYT